MGCLESIPVVQEYYNPDGELIGVDRKHAHLATKELAFVRSHDSSVFHPNDSCYLVDCEWHSQWIAFATGDNKTPPSSITNWKLLEPQPTPMHQRSMSTTSGHKQQAHRLRSGLKINVDFRSVNKDIWEYYFRKYGGGPVIVFPVPSGLADDVYLNGKWMRSVKHQLPTVVEIIVPSDHPMPSRKPDVTNPLVVGRSESLSTVQAGSIMMTVLSNAKFEEAQSLKKDIAKETAQLATELLAHSMGKKTLVAQLSVGDSKSRKVAAATLLQKTWRIKVAHQRREAMRKQHRKLLEEASALRIQSRWRLLRARREVKRLQMLRARQQPWLVAENHVFVIRMQSFARLCLAKWKFRTLQQGRRNIIRIRIGKVLNIPFATHPLVIAHVDRGLRPDYPISPPTTSNAMSALSMFQSLSASNSTTAHWDEELIVTNVCGNDKIVITFVSQTTGKGPHSFLGQIVLHMSLYAKLFVCKKVDLSGLPLARFTAPIRTIDGNTLPLSQTDRTVTGTADITLTLARMGTSHCGWMQKRAAHVFGGHQYKHRFVLLLDGAISYCNDEHSLDHMRATFVREDLERFEYGPDEHDHHETVLHMVFKSGDEWFFKWMPNADPRDARHWLRKLQYTFSHKKLNDEGSDSLVDRVEHSGNQSTRLHSVSGGNTMTAFKHTAKVMKRRSVAIFK